MREAHSFCSKTIPSNFEPLAHYNQILLSSENNILTFQGHPEMNEKLAKKFLWEFPIYTNGNDDDEIYEIWESMGGHHDGLEIWKCVVKWILDG
jgi:hypothetical protein